jgi:hypothetical protein
MKGSWTIQLEDGIHTIRAEVDPWTTLRNRLSVYLDDSLIHSQYVIAVLGELCHFENKGHVFNVRVEGFGYMGHLALQMDGRVVNPGEATPPTATTTASKAEAAPPKVPEEKQTGPIPAPLTINRSPENLVENQLTPITGIEGNQGNLNRLVTQLQTPLGVIPFVGAGLSVPLGFPGWSQFLLGLARQAGIESQIQSRLEKGEYEEAAEYLMTALAALAFNDAIDDAFGDHQDGGKPLQGAVSFLPQLANGPIITTNFDHVLERVFAQSGRAFEYIAWGARVGVAGQAFHQNRRFLLKIHGDVNDRLDRILTRSDYDAHYSNPNQPLPHMIADMLRTRTLLFCGCSLNQDRIVTVLQTIAQDDWADAHYAIVEKPATDDESHERARFLSAHDIRPIWYPAGRHDLLPPLVEFLVRSRNHAIAS